MAFIQMCRKPVALLVILLLALAVACGTSATATPAPQPTAAPVATAAPRAHRSSGAHSSSRGQRKPPAAATAVPAAEPELTNLKLIREQPRHPAGRRR